MIIEKKAVILLWFCPDVNANARQDDVLGRYKLLCKPMSLFKTIYDVMY